MKPMGWMLNWLQERSGGILALMAIIGTVLGSTAYIVDEIRDLEVELRAEIRAGDAELRQDIRAVDAQLREDIRSLDAKMTAGDAQLREEIRAGDAQLREEIRAGDAQLREEIRAGDAQLREEIRASDAELRLALENLSNRILDILSGGSAKPVKETAQPVSGVGGSTLSVIGR